MKKDFGDSLYLSHGVLWRTVINDRGNEFVADTPLCPNSSCHTILDITESSFYCGKCKKDYPREKDYGSVLREVRNSWEGFLTLRKPVYSLDLPPTKVVDEDKEDENYWVQARISEKQGRRMAVIYFGERLKGKQEKTDYVQIFLDFEDEQLRFDKSNKNPMKLMAKVTAEFQSSTTELNKRETNNNLE